MDGVQPRLRIPTTIGNGNNVVRWYNEDFDALLDALSQTADLEERAALAIQMNDMLLEDGAVIPLIFRAGVSAHHKHGFRCRGEWF